MSKNVSYHEVKRQAKDRIANRQWFYVLLACLIVGAISGAVSGYASFNTVSGGGSGDTHVSWIGSISEIIGTLLTGIMSYGMSAFMLNFLRNQRTDFEILFSGFRRIKESIIATILIGLITALGFIVFFIPGIIFTLSLSMTYYVLNDNPNMSAWEAMKESRRIMDGNKMELFKLYLSFLLWIILIIITVGIAAIYVAPYIATSVACFYEAIRPGRENEEYDDTSNVSSDDLRGFSSDNSDDITFSDHTADTDEDQSDTEDFFGETKGGSINSDDDSKHSDFF